METTYHLTVNILTPKGMLEMGKFFLGIDKPFAESIFNELEGSSDFIRYPSIRLDLVSTTKGALPVCLQCKGCDLNQYTQNCRILTKEVFRHFMFESGSPFGA